MRSRPNIMQKQPKGKGSEEEMGQQNLYIQINFRPVLNSKIAHPPTTLTPITIPSGELQGPPT